MNTTIEKIYNVNISESKIKKTKEVEEKESSVEKKESSNDQFCLKILDYFVF